MTPFRHGLQATGSLPAAVAAGVLAILLALDVVVGVAYLDLDVPPLLAGAGIALIVGAAGRHQLAATLAAASLSLAVTVGTSQVQPMAVPFGGGRGLPIATDQAFPSMAEVAGLALLLALALRSLRGAALFGAGAATAAALVGVAGRGGDSGYRPLVMIAIAVTASVAAGTGVYLRWVDHDRQRDVDDARQSERLAIARELHDVVAHYVTGIVVQAQAAQEVWDESPQAARSAMAQIEVAGSDALRSMRHLVGELRNDDAPSLTPTGHVDEINRLAERSTELGLPVRLDLEGLPDDLPPRHRCVGQPHRHRGHHQRPTARHGRDVGRGHRGGARGRAADPGAGRRSRHARRGRSERRLRRDRDVRAGCCARWVAPGGACPGTGMARRGHASGADVTSGTARRLRVLLADDQEMVRSGFRLILEANGMEVVGEAGDGRTALALARHLRPDVCLLDIRMPEPDGLEVTRLLAGPGVADPLAVVVVTTFDLDEYVRAAISNGASGFILKDAGAALLVEAVRAAAVGDALVSPSVTVRFLEHFRGVSSEPRQPAVPLTPREEDVLVAAARGRTNSEIGAELHMSLGTVKTHLGNLQSKLAARNRVELAAWAWETGRVR